MFAVGRLGSSIIRGVYTVSGPFHPFGGAVDMVVVEQEDGSFKSSPWYVRFGKFQGVLKAKEKIVGINVNGVEAGFPMYLDQRGEAYFLREVDSEEVDAILSPSSSGEEMDEKRLNGPLKSKSLDCRFDPSDSLTPIDVSNGKVLSRKNSRRSRILGFVLGRRSMKEDSFLNEDGSGVVRDDSLERAKIAADLLEMKWSTNLGSGRNKNDNATRLAGSENLNEEANKDGRFSDRQVKVMSLLHEEVPANNLETSLPHDRGYAGNNELKSDTSRKIDETFYEMTEVISVVNPQPDAGDEKCCNLPNDAKILERKTSSSNITTLVEETYSEGVPNYPENDSAEVESCNIFTISSFSNSASQVEDASMREVDAKNETSESLWEEQFMFSDLDDIKSSEIERVEPVEKDDVAPFPSEVNEAWSGSVTSNDESDSSQCKFVKESIAIDIGELRGNSERLPITIDIPRSPEVTSKEVGRQAQSLPIMWSQVDEFDPGRLQKFSCLDSMSKSSKWKLLRKDVSKIIKSGVEEQCQLSDSQPSNAAAHISETAKDESGVAFGDPSNIVDVSNASWGLWPFRRSRSRKFSQPAPNSEKGSEVDSVLENPTSVDGEKEAPLVKEKKMNIRVLTPTSEQLASLNLKEGRNTVTFRFSTAMLGSQQVEAQIYLWRWDTRIVISDVDGTITKSDVLGQFLPLVGRDWSQTGVAHLFSAIKENGYQLLFLSARAISQAYHTRQFLFNLKQDGKALPDGPVVISPDGLFPSLFREVIRRAPHEFKIACLEDIKACFPSDRNPFYAGFGNRDTDEFSYLKVGIPKGKIFIINPKGEVVVNRRVDSKSYTSLHALVHGMFPVVSSHEEEDYNSWNFWKLPPPTIDI